MPKKKNLSKKQQGVADASANSSINIAKSFTTPALGGALAIAVIHKDEAPDLATLIAELNKQVVQSDDGDISGVESMLVTQMSVLNNIFNRMAMQMGCCEYVDSLQSYADIAIKVQNQCRKTALAIAEIKNPKRATFIRQQNNAVNQQVNAGTQPKPIGQKSKKTFHENELLSKAGNHAALDDRRASKAISVNPHLEAVGAINRG